MFTQLEVYEGEPATENRAICEQKGNSAFSQQHIPAGYAFRLTSSTVIYSARQLSDFYFPFLLTLQSFKIKRVRF